MRILAKLVQGHLCRCCSCRQGLEPPGESGVRVDSQYLCHRCGCSSILHALERLNELFRILQWEVHRARCSAEALAVRFAVATLIACSLYAIAVYLR